MLDIKKANGFIDGVYHETVLSCREGSLAPVRSGANAMTLLELGVQMNCTQVKEQALDMLYRACIETDVNVNELK